MLLKFDKTKALSVGGTITQSGAYFGALTRVELISKPDTQVKYFEVDFKDGASGGKTTFWIYVVNHDGSENFNANKLHALFGIFNLADVPIVTDNEGKHCCPVLCRDVGIIVQKCNYLNKEGEAKYKFELLHFLDPVSKQTFTEIESSTPAALYKLPVSDKAPELALRSAIKGGATPAAADDKYVLPF